MTGYCPVPGPVPSSPANRDYAAGFTAAMMLKDLRLAQQAAGSSGGADPDGGGGGALYQMFVDEGTAWLRFLSHHRLIRQVRN